MESKTPIGSVILGVIILSLAMAQIQVEGIIYCPSTIARNCYKVCGLTGKPQEICAKNCGCKILSGTKFSNGYDKDILENSGDANEYCKLGCASSVCSAITTLQTSGDEVVNEAVEKCYNACSAFCTKGFTSTVESA